MSEAYYNEFDANAAQWLKNLIAAGELPDGEVDTRSILEVESSDLKGFSQLHFFAGIGGWPLALLLARWGDRPVITGSCPCQPFSAAGKGRGVEDERHLWPQFLRLIAQRLPATVFGEQVASKAGRLWLTGVRADLEALGYRVGAADLCAAGIGAPHIRQRLYWVADRLRSGRPEQGTGAGDGQVAGGSGVGGLPHSERAERRPPTSGRDESNRDDAGREETAGRAGTGREVGRMADDDDEGQQDGRKGRPGANGSPVTPWSDYRIVPCTDGKARRTGARVFPLAYGVPRGVDVPGSWRKGLGRSASRARVGVLKGSGNAIVPELAAVFVRSYMESRGL